jgi:hypothetical protein
MKKFTIVYIFIYLNLSICYAQKEVQIGNQVWMAENLDVNKFRNGDEIPEAKTFEEMKMYSNAKEPAWCYYNFEKKMGKFMEKCTMGMRFWIEEV